ncbi:uncharacterized protein FMAN_05488 [Fusarium mangiferae]|uniref:Uncharacterized protein n=1 Tax=Fusarium mangiferae TaxID=192010 RepID=A0A1L7SSU6_FUSMA|nr:uncharacterized protein FMAN_05488 [Fusarium mangiferae]CVK87562.1 uncharacterized protein FMAN_05488 [Fusarium mangiferae]
MSSITNCSWPDSLSDDVTASTGDLNKDKPVPHLDYVPPIATVKVKAFSEPWPGDNPTNSQRTEYVNAYLAWARHEDPALQLAVRNQARARIIRALPMIQAKDWTEAETDHLHYLIDEEYWRLCPSLCGLGHILIPYSLPSMKAPAASFIVPSKNPRESRIVHHQKCRLSTNLMSIEIATFTMQSQMSRRQVVVFLERCIGWPILA